MKRKRDRFIPEIINGREIFFEKRDHWILPKLRTIQQDYCFFYNLRYNCWVLYKFVRKVNFTKRLSYQANKELLQYRGKYVRIWDCKRTPGYWLYQFLIRKSLLKKIQSVSLGEYEEDLESPSTAEINSWNTQVDIYNEANKDLKWLQNGRTSILVGSSGLASVEKKRKKKKIIFVGLKTGKVLGVRNGS